MAKMSIRKLGSPDETRPFSKGRADIFHLEDGTVGRGTFQPGWKWSECVKPIAGTESCEAAHFGYVVSGHMHVAMDDGTAADFGTGDLINIAPGHDGWVVGNDACVVIDFEGASNYAKR